jgi:hypothetical protein
VAASDLALFLPFLPHFGCAGWGGTYWQGDKHWYNSCKG